MPRRVKSAERTLALFELFARRQVPLTVGAVARELGMPQPSASMLLRNLVTLGYLDYDRHTRLFAPTVRVMFLGNWISQQFNAICSMSHILECAQRKADVEFVYVARQNEVSVQYVWTVQTDPPNQLAIAPEVPRSLTCTAAGRMLLSMKPDQEVVGWVRRSNAEATADRLKVSESRFLGMHDQCRHLGFAETAGDFVPGLGALAVTIPATSGTSPLAIAFGGTIERVRRNRHRILAALQDVRERLAGGPSLAPPGSDGLGPEPC